MKSRGFFIKALLGVLVIISAYGCSPRPQLEPNNTKIKSSGNTSFFVKQRTAKNREAVLLPSEPTYTYVLGTGSAKYTRISHENARENALIEAAKVIEAYEDSLNHAVLSEVVSNEGMSAWSKIIKSAAASHWRSDIIAILDSCFIEVGSETVWANGGEYRTNLLGKFPTRCASVYWTGKVDKLLESANLETEWQEKIRMTRTYREELKLTEMFSWD